MKFSIIIQSSPFSRQSTTTAYRFAEALLEEGHELFRVFFYSDGVLAANQLVSPPQDENNIPDQWSALADKHKLDLVVCIAAAVKRGVIDENEAKRYEKPASNLQNTFELSGLGQLAEAIAISDRVITFGG
ncbi:sulfurtransferase complex subunit TusD [Neptuniibacter sp.]|uniref:sulfurtransferase complex subunit TusD n=1 Tax=Neptuniibacter sp. TaxID=1962643 RepID=UPI0026277320|nr:sulfurtransferase complex subunit TusD [Neptuniibacter sp.]MCP4595817.1 sulfurtransferase complex subunit TusD [Neptuniibacter sp.]